MFRFSSDYRDGTVKTDVWNMAEWSKAPVLKTGTQKCYEGSNPSIPATHQQGEGGASKD